MTLLQAIELNGWNPERDLATLAGFASHKLECMLPSAPLRYKVACQVILDAAEGC